MEKLQQVWPEFIRYFISGTLASLLLVIMPVLTMNPEMWSYFAGASGIVNIVLVILVMGFLVDTLKLYQISPFYKIRQQQFLIKFSGVLGVNSSEASTWFSVVSDTARIHGNTYLARKQSEWIMANHSAKILYIAFVLWLMIGVHFTVNNSLSHQIWAFTLGGISIVTGIRLHGVAHAEWKKSSKLFLLYAIKNKSQIASIFEERQI
jgi:hypothetical protein